MRTKKAFYNIISKTVLEIVGTICALILPRAMLLAFGSGYNGLISSITQFLGYISVLSLGVSNCTRLAVYKAKDDLIAKSAAIRASELYMRKIAKIFIGYTAALVLLYPYLMREEFYWLETASLVVIISVGVFAEYFFGMSIRAFLEAEQSGYISYVLQVITKVINALVYLGLIHLGFSVQIVKLASASCYAVSPIILNYFVKKKYGLRSDIVPNADIFKERKSIMINSLANFVHNSTDIFLLTLFTDAKTLSVYAVYSLVFSGLDSVQNVFTSGLEGAFGNMWVRGEKNTFKKNLEIFEYLLCALVSVLYSCTVVLILPFIRLYTRNVNDINYVLPLFAALAVAASGFYCLRIPYMTAVQAAGKYEDIKMHAIIQVAINFGLSLLLVFRWGLIGVTVGTLVANVYRMVQYGLFVSKNLLDQKIIHFLKKIGWALMNIAIITAMWQLLPEIHIENWGSWIVSALLCGSLAISLVCITSLACYREDFRSALKIVRRMLSARHNKQTKNA